MSPRFIAVITTLLLIIGLNLFNKAHADDVDYMICQKNQTLILTNIKEPKDLTMTTFDIQSKDMNTVCKQNWSN